MFPELFFLVCSAFHTLEKKTAFTILKINIYVFSYLVPLALRSLEYLRIKIFNAIEFSLLQPLIGCKCLKVLHLITFPDYTNYPYHDRTETLTFDKELKLFEIIPSLNLLIVYTEYGKRQFYRGDLFDLKSYFTKNILKYREPQRLASYIRQNLMSKDDDYVAGKGKINAVNSADLSDVSKYLGVEVKVRSLMTSLAKNLQRYCEVKDEAGALSSSNESIDSEDIYLENSTGSSEYELLGLDGKFTDCSDDSLASEECEVD